MNIKGVTKLAHMQPPSQPRKCINIKMYFIPVTTAHAGVKGCTYPKFKCRKNGISHAITLRRRNYSNCYQKVLCTYAKLDKWVTTNLDGVTRAFLAAQT